MRIAHVLLIAFPLCVKSTAQLDDGSPIIVTPEIVKSDICEVGLREFDYSFELAVTFTNSSKNAISVFRPADVAGTLVAKDDESLSKRQYETKGDFDTFGVAIPRLVKIRLAPAESFVMHTTVPVWVTTKEDKIEQGFVAPGTHLLQLKYFMKTGSRQSTAGHYILSQPVTITLETPFSPPLCSSSGMPTPPRP